MKDHFQGGLIDMSYMKNILFDYALKYHMDEERLSTKDLLKLQIQMFLDFYQPLSNKDFVNFFLDLFSDDPNENYWIMASDNEETYNLECPCVDKLIEYASILSQQKYNVYFCPNAFTGWRTDSNVVSTRAIFIDIDDIEGADFSHMSTETLKTWLMDTYEVPEPLLPNWVVCSGHGLHLYYLIPKMNLREEDNRILRRQYTDYLITYFSADKACRNSSRILRVPHSYNVKHEECKTYLHHLNKSDIYDLERLDYFYSTKDSIEEYMKKNQEEKNAKSRATRKRNKQLKELQYEDNLQNTAVHKKESKAKLSNVSEYNLSKLSDMTYCTSFHKESRYWNIVKDLHNYYMRHGGNIINHRNLFFFIMAVNLRHIMPLDSAIDFLEKYMDSDNIDESITTIRCVYERKVPYRLKNITIAELLAFTDNDIRLSYCNFSEERIDQARKETQRRNNIILAEKRKAERDFEGYQYNLYINVKDNPANLTVKELALYLGVSESTIKRIRKKIRAEKE